RTIPNVLSRRLTADILYRAVGHAVAVENCEPCPISQPLSKVRLACVDYVTNGSAQGRANTRAGSASRPPKGAEESMAREPGELPGYQRGEPIQDSSASSVYRARRLSDGACVVVKRSRGKEVSAGQLTRYRNEFELLRAIASDGVVKAYELVRHDGQIALVLEDLPGVSLRRWLESQIGVTLEQRLRIAAQLAKVLAEVHAANIIHKDISSHNVV